MSERWRCFVAVPIGPDLSAALRTAVERWRSRPDLEGLRWTDPDAWHLTLAFIGAVEADTVDTLRATLAGVASTSEPLTLTTGGVGGFPSARQGRVAWYGVADPDSALHALARRVRERLGLDPAAPFRGHVTLGRAKRDPVDLRAWRDSASAPAGTMEVRTLQLMRSHLGRGPARYELIESAALQAAARV